MSKLQIKQISGKPAVKYGDIEPGVVFTFNRGSLFGNEARLKAKGGNVVLSDFTFCQSTPGGELCTVYKSTLTMEV